jgi:HlyD family secretion protein
VAVGVPGVIATVKCVEGQRVERGELLFELDPRALAVAVNFAEKTLARQRKLAETDGTSVKLVQEAEQQLAAAQAQVALSQVRAPIAGIVTKVNIKVGEAADLTTVLAELVDFDRLVISAGVASAELAGLKSGQPVDVLTPDATNAVASVLGYVGPNVDMKTGTGLVRAVVPANSGLRLGQFVKVRVTTGEHKDILAVPLASLAKDNTGAWFIAMVEGEKAVLKPVKPGLRDGDWAEVEGDGVEADKPVVTEGAYGLVMTQQFATKIQVAAQ